MKCPCCGVAELVHGTRDESYNSKDGIKTTIPAVTGVFCPACGESLLDGAQAERVMTVLRAAIQAGANSGPGVDVEQVFTRLEHRYGR